jgi:hypothetical protein
LFDTVIWQLNECQEVIANVQNNRSRNDAVITIIGHNVINERIRGTHDSSCFLDALDEPIRLYGLKVFMGWVIDVCD